MNRACPPVGALLSLAILSLAPSLRAALPAELAKAVQFLRDQRSYSWESINADPGPVRQTIDTARGPVTTVQQNLAPHIRGRRAANGEMWFERDWPDGLAMQTFVAADGATVTKTPEGWLSRTEILEAIAQERLLPAGTSKRLEWLPRAEAIETLHPVDELAPFLDPTQVFDEIDGAFTCKLEIQRGSPGSPEAQSVGNATISIHLAGGLLRDYEIKTEISRRVTRSRISIVSYSDCIVILSYLPVGRLDVPAEARAKLKASAAKPPR